MGVEAGCPEHEEALATFLEGCRRAGKPCGLPTRTSAATRSRIEQGFSFIDFSSDFRFLDGAARQALEEVHA